MLPDGLRNDKLITSVIPPSVQGGIRLWSGHEFVASLRHDALRPKTDIRLRLLQNGLDLTQSDQDGSSPPRHSRHDGTR
jgi:hypothetical protein